MASEENPTRVTRHPGPGSSNSQNCGVALLDTNENERVGEPILLPTIDNVSKYRKSKLGVNVTRIDFRLA